MKHRASVIPVVFAAAGLGLTVGGLALARGHAAGPGIALPLSCLAVTLALANRRALERNLDRAQFAMGVLIIVLVLLQGAASDRLSRAMYDAGSSSNSRATAAGYGVMLTLGGAVMTLLGALLGNTPEPGFMDDG